MADVLWWGVVALWTLVGIQLVSLLDRLSARKLMEALVKASFMRENPLEKP